jgi:hypothetical protein
METGSTWSFQDSAGGMPRTPGMPSTGGSAPGSDGALSTGGSAPGASGSAPGATAEEANNPMRKCTICQCDLTLFNWPPQGGARCRECKTAYENLRGIAEKQGQETWWLQTRLNAEALAKVVSVYKRICPRPRGGSRGSCGPYFTVERYLGTCQYQASSGVSGYGHGNMTRAFRLGQESFAARWPTSELLQGHNPESALSQPQAEARREEMLAKPDDERPRDKTGPVGDPVRQGLEKNGEHGDMAAIAQSMVSTTSSNDGRAPSKGACSGTGVFKPNLGIMIEDIQEDAFEKQAKTDAQKKKRLHLDAPEDDEPSAKGDMEAAGTGGTSSDHTGTTPKAKVDKAKRWQETAYARLDVLLKKSHKMGLEALEDIDGLTADEAKHYDLEKDTLVYRMKFLTKIVQDAKTEEEMMLLETELKALIRDGETKRPPAFNYELLAPLAKLRLAQTAGFVDLVWTAESQDDVFRFCRILDASRAPVANLARSVAKASVDLVGAMKKRKRLAEEKASAALKKSRVAVPPDQAPAVNPIFEMDGLETMPNMSNAVVLHESDLDRPFVMHMPLVSKTLQAGPCPLVISCCCLCQRSHS